MNIILLLFGAVVCIALYIFVVVKLIKRIDGKKYNSD
jgi:hypothetical protein